MRDLVDIARPGVKHVAGTGAVTGWIAPGGRIVARVVVATDLVGISCFENRNPWRSRWRSAGSNLPRMVRNHSRGSERARPAPETASSVASKVQVEGTV